jgi:hypothetical protein
MEKRTLRIAHAGGSIDHAAIRTAAQASNQKGRPANWPQPSKDRPGITTSDSLTVPAPPTLEEFTAAIKRQQDFLNRKDGK